MNLRPSVRTPPPPRLPRTPPRHRAHFSDTRSLGEFLLSSDRQVMGSRTRTRTRTKGHRYNAPFANFYRNVRAFVGYAVVGLLVRGCVAFCRMEVSRGAMQDQLHPDRRDGAMAHPPVIAYENIPIVEQKLEVRSVVWPTYSAVAISIPAVPVFLDRLFESFRLDAEHAFECVHQLGFFDRSALSKGATNNTRVREGRGGNGASHGVGEGLLRFPQTKSPFKKTRSFSPGATPHTNTR